MKWFLSGWNGRRRQGPPADYLSAPHGPRNDVPNWTFVVLSGACVPPFVVALGGDLAAQETTMHAVRGLPGYTMMLAVLLIAGFAGAVALLSPLTVDHKKAIAQSAAKSDDPAEPLAAASVERRNFPIGPAVVHYAPAPPSQSDLAKLRLKASDDELRARAMDMRDRSRSAARSAYAPTDRHSSNF